MWSKKINVKVPKYFRNFWAGLTVSRYKLTPKTLRSLLKKKIQQKMYFPLVNTMALTIRPRKARYRCFHFLPPTSSYNIRFQTRIPDLNNNGITHKGGIPWVSAGNTKQLPHSNRKLNCNYLLSFKNKLLI